jgi:hypothetical protein
MVGVHATGLDVEEIDPANGLRLLRCRSGPVWLRRGGRLQDRAVHRDLMERLRENCSAAELQQFCADPRSQKCHEHCLDDDGM